MKSLCYYLNHTVLLSANLLWKAPVCCELVWSVHSSFPSFWVTRKWNRSGRLLIGRPNSKVQVTLLKISRLFLWRKRAPRQTHSYFKQFLMGSVLLEMKCEISSRLRSFGIRVLLPRRPQCRTHVPNYDCLPHWSTDCTHTALSLLSAELSVNTLYVVRTTSSSPL